MPLEIENIQKFFGPNAVLRGVSTEFEDGEITGVIGPGGGGKSTLLKILGKVIRQSSGEIIDPQRVRAHTALMFQEGALFDSLSTLDNVAFPILNGRVPISTLPRALRVSATEKAVEALAQVGLKHAIHKMPAQLSGGMRKRVSLARALVARPTLLLLDDPTAGLDPVASSVIMELIQKVHNQLKPTTIIVSHDLRRLLPITDSILALFDGKVRFRGNLRQLEEFDAPTIKKFVSCRYELESGNPCHP